MEAVSGALFQKSVFLIIELSKKWGITCFHLLELEKWIRNKSWHAAFLIFAKSA